MLLTGWWDQEIRERNPRRRKPGTDHDEDGVQASVQPLPRLRPCTQEGLHQSNSQVG